MTDLERKLATAFIKTYGDAAQRPDAIFDAVLAMYVIRAHLADPAVVERAVAAVNTAIDAHAKHGAPMYGHKVLKSGYIDPDAIARAALASVVTD